MPVQFTSWKVILFDLLFNMAIHNTVEYWTTLKCIYLLDKIGFYVNSHVFLSIQLLLPSFSFYFLFSFFIFSFLFSFSTSIYTHAHAHDFQLLLLIPIFILYICCRCFCLVFCYWHLQNTNWLFAYVNIRRVELLNNFIYLLSHFLLLLLLTFCSIGNK